MSVREFADLAIVPQGVRLAVWFARVAVPGNRWIDHCWEVAGLAVDPVAALGAGARDPGWVRRDCPPLRLHGDEAEGYLLNAEAAMPSLFLLLRGDDDVAGDVQAAAPPRVAAVSVSFHEAARWMDGGASVECVPLPAGWAESLAAYGRTHLKAPEEKRPKRRYAASGDLHDRPGH